MTHLSDSSGAATMAKPPVPNTKPWASLFPPERCMVCYHEAHPPFGSPCQHNDDAWQDPMVGGDPANEPRICGCTEYLNKEQAGRIRVVMEADKARAPFTPEQVESLRARQKAPLHQYTCLAHSDAALEPGADGLRCPVGGCGFLQEWALKSDTEPQSWVLTLD